MFDSNFLLRTMTTIEDVIIKSIEDKTKVILSQYLPKRVLTANELHKFYGSGFKTRESFLRWIAAIGISYRGSQKNKLFDKDEVERIILNQPKNY